MPKYCSGAQSQFRQVGGQVTGDLLGRGQVTVGMEDEQNRLVENREVICQHKEGNEHSHGWPRWELERREEPEELRQVHSRVF